MKRFLVLFSILFFTTISYASNDYIATGQKGVKSINVKCYTPGGTEILATGAQRVERSLIDGNNFGGTQTLVWTSPYSRHNKTPDYTINENATCVTTVTKL